jgi:tRNA G18 (ribose-2'-O)-methylase SpoU
MAGTGWQHGVIEVSALDDERLASYRWAAEPRALEARGLFVAEGRLVVERLLTASSEPGRWSGAVESVLLSPAAFDSMNAVVAAHPGVPAFVAPQAVMNGIVGFNIHRGCLAVGRRPAVPTLDAALLAGLARVLVLEGVNNPDNMGGIFRSAAALGGDLVVLGPACADPLYRKSVRTSMGAALAVPYARADPWPDAIQLLRSAGFLVIALTPSARAAPLSSIEPVAARVALLAGAEGAGLSEAALASADREVTIPMTGRVDSLNVGTAAAIALYHVRGGLNP